MPRPARPARGLVTAVAAAAVAVALLVAPAQAAPAPAGPSTVRVVTPPTSVSRAALVRLMRQAGRATDRALDEGARLRATWGGGLSAVAAGRIRDGRSRTRDASGRVLITDYRSGAGWIPIADAVDGLGVTPAQLSEALAELGKPDAGWVLIATRAGRAPVLGADLVREARRASTWAWARAHGVTTWRLGWSRILRTSIVYRLDERQRLVRQTITQSADGPVRFRMRVDVRMRYVAVAPITLPTEERSVGLSELLTALGVPQDDMPVVVPRVAAPVEAQIAMLRTMSGH